MAINPARPKNRLQKQPILLLRPWVSQAKLSTTIERRVHKPLGTSGQPALDRIETTYYRAVEDLRTLVLHVRALINDQRTIVEPVDEWLVSLLSAAENLQQWLKEKKFYEEGPFSKARSRDIEEIDNLEYLCQSGMVQIDDLFTDFDNETLKDELLTAMIGYWIDEVRNRAFDVYHLFIGAIYVDTVEKCFAAVDDLQYPIS